MRNSCRAAFTVLMMWSLGGPAARHLEAQVGESAARRLGGWVEGPTGGGAVVQPSGSRVWAAWQESLVTARRRAAEPPSRRAVEWYHLAAGLGVVALASTVDEQTRDELQAHRTSGKDDVAGVFRQMGEPEIYGTIGLGTLAVGVISGNDRITRAGGRISSGLLIAAATTTFLKEAVGRGRPSHFKDQYRFRPISGRDSWPSGHATMAFALAASVSDEIRSTPVTITLYSAATLTGWSRMNDNRHWLSDVLAGAAVGITSAKLMNGRWTVLGIKGPRFLLEPERVGVSLGF
jgi:membrane-associated phospholipid phosphatase